MAYAAPQDMVARFGQAEMIRLSTPSDQPMTQVNAPPIMLALQDASDLIDTYVRRRYTVPMTNIPPTIVRCACVLARYDLSLGDQKQPSDQVKEDRKVQLAWLEGISAGKVLLDLTEVPAGDESFAIMSDRGAVYGPGMDANTYPQQNTYPPSDTGGQPALDGTPLPPFETDVL